MKPNAGRHCSEETLEHYSMGSLPETRAVPVGDHLLACAGCRRWLREIKSFVAATREALRRAADAPVDFLHHTSVGVIRVFVQSSSDGG